MLKDLEMSIEFITQLRHSIRLNGFIPRPLPTGGKQCFEPGWPEITEKDAIDYQMELAKRGKLNTGILGNGLFMVDVDVDDAVRSVKLHKLAIERLGPMLMRTRENSPRFALIYGSDDFEFRYLHLPGAYHKDNGKLEEIEVLGKGHQLLCFGWHHTGVAIKWEDDKGPHNTKREDLTILTKQQIVDYLLEAAPIHGVDIEQAKKFLMLGDHKRCVEHEVISIKDVEETLDAIPNDERVDRPFWINIGMAIYDARDGADDGLRAWIKWSEQHPGALDGTYPDEEKVCEKEWKTFDRYMTKGWGFGSLVFLARKYNSGWQLSSRISKKDVGTWKDGDKPGITWQEHKLNATIDLSEDILIEREVELFTRGLHLVTPRRVIYKTGTPSIVLLPVVNAWMTTILNREISWRKFLAKKDDGGKQIVRRIMAPDVIVAPMLVYNRNYKYRPINGIVHAPTLNPNGDLLYKPGYDPETKLWLVDDPAFHGIETRLNMKPDEGEVMVALERIEKNILAEVAFASMSKVDGGGEAGDVSKSVALSGFLTVAARGMLEMVPLHVFGAPIRGSGKSYVINLPAYMAIGGPLAAMTVSIKPDEFEKKLTSHLRQGTPLLNIDNINGELNSSLLNQMLSEPLVEVRPFNQNEANEHVPYMGTPFANGNHITLVGDIIRRAIYGYLDTKMEHPETKRFVRKPHEYILGNRCLVLIDCLTIVLGYIHAGCPGKLDPLPGFNKWSDYIRSALVYYGRVDCVKSQVWMRAYEPEISLVKEVMGALEYGFGINFMFTVHELIEMVGNGDEVMEAVQNALLLMSKIKAKKISATDLGDWLRGHENTNFGGRKFVRVGKKHNAIVWGYCEADKNLKPSDWNMLSAAKDITENKRKQAENVEFDSLPD